MFHSLKYAKMLEDVGFTKEQAETSIEILLEIMESKLATKEDIKFLATKDDLLSLATKEELNALKLDFSSLKEEFSSLKEDFSGLKDNLNGLREEVKLLRADLTIRMGAMMVATVGAIAALQKFL